MEQTIDINGRALRVCISGRARKQLRRLATPLYPELELYFSCLLRKRVYVRECLNGFESHVISGRLSIRFRPERFFPHGLSLDYRAGEWHADFGYTGSLC